ncbi:helix-turn-helix transcriptional regulator [Natronomonas amylolytica]|uniref:helix-turn-helix transcriptional regulator n=1 Tax=Natronomonas amylolytica TaxID=3108498 RepID=UPI00300A58C3
MSRSRGPTPAAVLTLAFAVVLVSTALLGGLAPVAASDGPAGGAALTQSVDADRVEFRVTVYENGSAEWLFRYEQQLESDTERQDFEAFAEEFNTNETDLYLNFRDRAETLTASGTNATGREMNAEAFSREARVEERGIDASREFGVVEMSFRWTAFAAEEDGRLVVGDVFDGGLYVGPEQAVVFSPGPNLQFQEVRPDDADYSGGTLAESDSVTWEGERSFTDNRPRVVYVEAGSEPATTGSTTGSDPGLLLPLAALVVVVLLGAVAAVAYRAGMLPPSGGDAAADADSSDGDAGGVEGGSEGGAAGAEAAAPDGEADAGAEGAAAGATISEEDLLSDEERVVSLLEDHGGRMKQVQIVDETGWSKSKVSMLLSDMEEEGTISKLRVGRENIVSLSGHEPDAAGSPFDDDS